MNSTEKKLKQAIQGIKDSAAVSDALERAHEAILGVERLFSTAGITEDEKKTLCDAKIAINEIAVRIDRLAIEREWQMLSAFGSEVRDVKAHIELGTR